MNITVSDLLNIDHTRAYNIDVLEKMTLRGISIDSRTLKSGQIFFAIRGKTYDGNNFIKEVFEQGAACAVVSKKSAPLQLPTRPLLLVEDTTKALGDLANIYRNKFTVPVIAIAGSNGKTTTKEMLAACLSTKYSTLYTESNLNNHIGVPMTLFRLNNKHQIAVVETGTNHFGEMHYLCNVLEPTHGIITNIGPEHLQYFHDLEGVMREEGRLFRTLENSGLGFVNIDDKYINVISKKLKNKITYGFSNQNCNVCGRFLSMNGFGHTVFEVKQPNKKPFTVKLSVPGKHAMLNAFAAAVVSLTFGVSPTDIRHSLKKFKSFDKRMDLSTISGVTIINDTYNANSQSVISALDTLQSMKCRGKKIVILADMLELGSKAKKEHRRIAAALNRMKLDDVITLGPLAETINMNSTAKRKFHFRRKDQLSEYVSRLISKGDIVLVKGSRSMQMETVVISIRNYLNKIS